MKQGKITPNGVILKTHESATVVLITAQGFNVELIPKSNVQGVHTPDIIVNGIRWEIKSPIGEGKFLMANTIQKAVKQSRNIIIDLRRTKRHQDKCLRELEKEFQKSKSVLRLKIITKDSKIIDLFK